MSKIITMQVEAVRDTARKMENCAGTFTIFIHNLSSSISQLTYSWQGSSSDEFIAEIRTVNQKLDGWVSELQTLVKKLQNEIIEWEMADELPGQSTQRTGAVASGGVIAAAAAGKVLGVSSTTVSDYAAEYQSYSWNAKFAEEERIKGQKSELEAKLKEIPSEEKCKEFIALLNKQIAEVEKTKQEMESEARKFINMIPGNLKGETASSIYKEEAKRCEEQLAFLNERKGLYENALAEKNQIEAQLEELNQRQNALDKVINAGITSSGPTPASLRNRLAGCVNYVASKTNIEGFYKPGQMNATNWDNNAIAAGYEVGSRPVAGSIMVIEADQGRDNGFMNVDNTAGHVAYVEKVTRVDGGYQVTISHADTKYVNGKYQSGVYVNERTTTTFMSDENPNVHFIYGK